MSKYKNIKYSTWILAGVFIEIILLLVLSGRAIEGDHAHYRNYYSYVAILDFEEFLNLDSRGYIGSLDYLYNFTVFLFSRIVDFDSFTFIINIIYFFLFCKIFKILKINFLIPLLPFTFYMVGLQFSAQRLIIALSIFGFSYLNKRGITSILSLFSHMQVLPLFLILLKPLNFPIILLAFMFALLLGFYFDINAAQKLVYYALSRGEIKVTDYLYIIVMFMAVKFSYKKEDLIKIVVAFGALAAIVTIIGDGRINIIVYFLTLLFLVDTKQVSIYSKGILISFIIYDLIKGVLFIGGILSGNSGFEAL